jgi:hypothetical protein
MHFPTLVRKSAYSFLGKTLLSDKVRNFAYGWAWAHLRNLPTGTRILDIGSRDSLFPAFLAWQGYCVSVVERDSRFGEMLRTIQRRWNVRYEVHEKDFLEFDAHEKFGAVLSLFSLQHAGDDDIPAYRKSSAMLDAGGMFLSACEYDEKGTRWHRGRDDGALRIYGPADVEERIERTLSASGLTITERKITSCTSAKRFIVGKASSDAGGYYFVCARTNRTIF